LGYVNYDDLVPFLGSSFGIRPRFWGPDLFGTLFSWLTSILNSFLGYVNYDDLVPFLGSSFGIGVRFWDRGSVFGVRFSDPGLGFRGQDSVLGSDFGVRVRFSGMLTIMIWALFWGPVLGSGFGLRIRDSVLGSGFGSRTRFWGPLFPIRPFFPIFSRVLDPFRLFLGSESNL